ncbi:MAG: surface polysaccharide biosynthesis protein [Bacteroidetes bacterium]|nr:MAG: surface polysaccharide biosynthesis protein [Bacteroidota bacterium]
MSVNKTMLITGATGFIGQALLHHFLGQGWKIVALVRKDPAEKIPGVIYQHFDLHSPRLDSDTFKGIDVFIHAAYVKAEKGVDAFTINTKAARQLHESALRQQVAQTVFISSLAAKKEAVSEYGKQKFAVEEIFSGAQDVVVRPGLVLGPGGLFGKMRAHIEKRGRIPLIGGGKQPLQTVHIDDLVAAIEKIIETKAKGVFTIAEPEPVPYREFYEELCRVLNGKPQFKYIPYWFMSFVLRTAGIFGMELPVNSDNLRGLKTMQAVDSKASLTKLGIRVKDYKESLQAIASAR